MIRLAVILVIIISVSGGAYSLVILSRLRKIYRIDYLHSFFYYKLLHFFFGIYGILGGIAVRDILLKYDIKNAEIESIAIIIPFFGVPFIIAAWYLLIKTSHELIKRKLQQSVSIVFFVIATASFLVYGFVIRYLPGSTTFSSAELNLLVRIVFYSLDLAVKIYVMVLLVSSAMRCNNKDKRILLVRFGFITAGLAVLSAFALHFAFRNILAGPYFLLLYFGSDLVLVFLMKAYLGKNADEFNHITDPLENLYQKYGISKREREIISGICKGKTNQEIADELFISVQTVKDHTYNIFRKVNVRNRVQLAHIFSKHNK